MADETQANDWVTITTCRTLPEADLLATDLRAAGIEALIPDEALMQNVAWNVNTYGYIRLQVQAKDVAVAKSLLHLDQNAAGAQTEEPKTEREWSNVPLPWSRKLVTLLLPAACFLGVIIFAVMRRNYANRGFTRKAKDLTTWFLLSLGLWFIAFVFASAHSHKP